MCEFEKEGKLLAFIDDTLQAKTRLWLEKTKTSETPFFSASLCHLPQDLIQDSKAVMCLSLSKWTQETLETGNVGVEPYNKGQVERKAYGLIKKHFCGTKINTAKVRELIQQVEGL